MADQKISAMPAATTPLTGAELVPIVQSGGNVRTTIANFGQYGRSTFSNYGGFQDTTTQIGSTTVGTPFTFNTGDFIANGVTLALNSRLTVAVGGVYNLQWSAQLQNTDVGPQDVWVWLRINGADVTGSTGVIGLPARKTPSDPYHSLVGWNFFVTLTAGQYVEVVWLKSAATVTVPAYPASTSPAYPSTASVVITLNQVG